jgi:hypothetical protein
MVLAIFAVIGLIGYFEYKKEKERTLAIETAAKSLGFTFDKTGVACYDVTMSTFKLFTSGHSRRCRNVMEQQGPDVSISHFDYSYSIGSGKSRTTYNQTVTVFTGSKLKLPSFFMGPENFFHRIGDVLGLKDIDFDDAPEFSKSYLLKGSDEAAIRLFFDSTLLRFFKDRPGLNLETSDHSFIVYNKSKRTPVDEIAAELKSRIEIYSMFLNRSGSST